MLLVARHLEDGVGKDVHGYNVLLHQADQQHNLKINISQRKVARRCLERV